MIKLPSQRTLRDYKHSCPSKSGFSVDTDLQLLELLRRQKSELGKLLYESNILHITSYFYKEVIYYSYILLYQKSKYVILLVTFKSNNIM